MLRITIPSNEFWDERTEEFVYTKEYTLELEHSLLSLSKWESKWCKPFLSNVELTDEEALDYIRCMTITKNVDPEVYSLLSIDNLRDINNYISAPMTATTVNERNQRGSKEIVTAEIIYYWMVSLNIPFECQKWHLNRLLMLIKVCTIKNEPAKKMNKRDVMKQNAALNAARKKKLNTTG